MPRSGKGDVSEIIFPKCFGDCTKWYKPGKGKACFHVLNNWIGDWTAVGRELFRQGAADLPPRKEFQAQQYVHLWPDAQLLHSNKWGQTFRP